ncbi:hypothetical protein [Moorena sp. SIO3I6]|uniref:hypothetical protein n=1 Tax=Moorena sp. SIO3I6 TaxID=2607831 RepID=UPI0013F74A2F|nr:hypothetical protein [Moorena sp. SIO3I6]NEP25880.1 hypothetical protein [Moorena sp. SIO3I6]
MQNKPEVGGDRKKPFFPHSPPNNLGLLATESRSTFNLQPWPKATQSRSTSNLQPPTFNLQPPTLAKGHAIAFNLQPSTFNLQPPNLLTS